MAQIESGRYGMKVKYWNGCSVKVASVYHVGFLYFICCCHLSTIFTSDSASRLLWLLPVNSVTSVPSRTFRPWWTTARWAMTTAKMAARRSWGAARLRSGTESTTRISLSATPKEDSLYVGKLSQRSCTVPLNVVDLIWSCFGFYQKTFAVLHCYPDTVFMLQVMVDVDDKNEWKECIDIGGVRLPTGYFFGASAATGDLSGGYLLQMFSNNMDELLARLSAFSPV